MTVRVAFSAREADAVLKALDTVQVQHLAAVRRVERPRDLEHERSAEAKLRAALWAAVSGGAR